MVKLLIKKLDKKVITPEYKTKGSSGMDLMANIKDAVFHDNKSKKSLIFDQK